MLRYGDSGAFSSINIFRDMLKGSTMHGFYTVLLLAEAGDSCLSPRPRVQIGWLFYRVASLNNYLRIPNISVWKSVTLDVLLKFKQQHVLR